MVEYNPCTSHSPHYILADLCSHEFQYGQLPSIFNSLLGKHLYLYLLKSLSPLGLSCQPAAQLYDHHFPGEQQAFFALSLTIRADLALIIVKVRQAFCSN